MPAIPRYAAGALGNLCAPEPVPFNGREIAVLGRGGEGEEGASGLCLSSISLGLGLAGDASSNRTQAACRFWKCRDLGNEAKTAPSPLNLGQRCSLGSVLKSVCPPGRSSLWLRAPSRSRSREQELATQQPLEGHRFPICWPEVLLPSNSLLPPPVPSLGAAPKLVLLFCDFGQFLLIFN